MEDASFLADSAASNSKVRPLFLGKLHSRALSSAVRIRGHIFFQRVLLATNKVSQAAFQLKGQDR